MKKIILKVILLLSTVQCSFGQFRQFYHASAGFVHSQGAAITQIAFAGGGVVLKTKAIPSLFLSPFTAVNVVEGSEISTMYLRTPETTIAYSDSSWIMRDAAMLVRSEGSEMYRDVNLLGKIQPGEKTPANLKNYYIVEVANALRNTRSGQTLIYMDLMLTGGNTAYYSSSYSAAKKYLSSSDSLSKIIQDNNYNDPAVRHVYDSLLFKGKHLVALNKGKKNKSAKYLKTIYYKLDFLLNYGRWNDYTYNDEDAGYNFFFEKNGNHLFIKGAPSFTFLYDDPYRGSMILDDVHTSYYKKHPWLIKNLNYIVVNNAEHFGKIAAFYRYLKDKYPGLWSQVYLHYLATTPVAGDTPRFIYRTPPNY